MKQIWLPNLVVTQYYWPNNTTHYKILIITREYIQCIPWQNIQWQGEYMVYWVLDTLPCNIMNSWWNSGAHFKEHFNLVLDVIIHGHCLIKIYLPIRNKSIKHAQKRFKEKCWQASVQARPLCASTSDNPSQWRGDVLCCTMHANISLYWCTNYWLIIGNQLYRPFFQYW